MGDARIHANSEPGYRERPATSPGPFNANLEWTRISGTAPQAPVWKQRSPDLERGNQPDLNSEAGTCQASPVSQGRMGVKRRLVDQGLWSSAGWQVAKRGSNHDNPMCDTGTAKFDR